MRHGWFAAVTTAMAMAVAIHAPAWAQEEPADATALATALVRDSRVAERALVGARGELWKQVRTAGRAELPKQHARYRCISMLDAQALSAAFVALYARQIDTPALAELTAFYARREVQWVVDDRLRAWRQANAVPQAPRMGFDRRPADETSAGQVALNAMQATPAHRRFDAASQAAYSGPVRAALAELQDQCTPDATPPPATVSLKVAGAPAPLAPPAALQRGGIEGRLEAEIELDASGKPVSAAVLHRWFNGDEVVLPDGQRATVESLLDAPVVTWLMQATLLVAADDAQPLAGRYRVPLNFLFKR